jgi:hypothetical protein
VESLKIPKPEEQKEIETVDRWEVHVNRSWNPGESTLGKASVEELKILKFEVPKWTKVIDLRWMCGVRSRTLSMEYSGGKQRVEASKRRRKSQPLIEKGVKYCLFGIGWKVEVPKVD